MVSVVSFSTAAILSTRPWQLMQPTPLQISGGSPPEKYEQFGSTDVWGRPGQPAELASIYVQLAAPEASFATGNIYGAGGGQGQP